MKLHLIALILWFSALSNGQQTVNIHAIQTNLPNSAYLGDLVTTEGIVVAVTKDGLYIENSPFHTTCTKPSILNCWDALNSTSEGIFVYTKTAPDPDYAGIGNLVEVTGIVTTSNSSADKAAQGTEIQVTSTPFRVDHVNYTVPVPVAPWVLDPATTGTFGQWLPFEGMRVNIPVLIATSGTGGTVETASQTATSNGQFWGVIPDPSGATARPFRATGISVLEPVPASAPQSVSRWSGNPSLLFIDGSNHGGAQPALDVTANSTVTKLTGVVDYHGSPLGYTAIILDNDPPYYYGYQPGAVTPGPGANGTPAVTAAGNQATIATWDLDNFHDTSVVNATGFMNRIDKAALAIVHFLNSPDILAVQQVQSIDALNALASQIEADGGPAYTPCWFAGNDESELTNGFLVNKSRVTVTSCTQADAGKTFAGPDGSTQKLFDRPPLVLVAGIQRPPIADYPLTIVNSEFLDRANIDDPQLGPAVRAQRAAQAEELSRMVQSYQSAGQHVVALGDYHSFEFSDGFVDTMGAVDGDPVAAGLVTVPVSTFTQPPMMNPTTEQAADDRYTFVENGSAEDTDHILVTADMASMASVSYAHFGADFPVTDLNDPTTALHASSHDGVVAYLAIPQPAQLTLTSSANPSFYRESVTFTATANGNYGTPTGTITFSDGNTPLCAAVAMSSGSATCSTNTLSIGSHQINAAYRGDLAYAPAAATLTQPVLPDPVFSMTISPSVASIYTGERATYVVTILPGKYFALDVALSCSDLPPSSTCTISPSTVTGGKGIARLVVQTSPPVNTRAMAHASTARKVLPFLACLFVISVPLRSRRWGRWFFMAILLPILAVTMGACGSSGTLAGGTLPATYSLTVTGNAIGGYAPVVETTTTSLKVNSLF